MISKVYFCKEGIFRGQNMAGTDTITAQLLHPQRQMSFWMLRLRSLPHKPDISGSWPWMFVAGSNCRASRSPRSSEILAKFWTEHVSGKSSFVELREYSVFLGIRLFGKEDRENRVERTKGLVNPVFSFSPGHTHYLWYVHQNPSLWNLV